MGNQKRLYRSKVRERPVRLAIKGERDADLPNPNVSIAAREIHGHTSSFAPFGAALSSPATVRRSVH